RAERAMGLRHAFVPALSPAEVSEPVEAASAAVRPGDLVERTIVRSSPTARSDDTGGARPAEAAPPATRRPEPAVAAAIAPPAASPPAAAGGDVELFGGAGAAGGESFASPELSPVEKAAALATLDEQQVRGCVKCPLSRGRRNTVFGEGDANAALMFVGEGPGGTEDATGRPFVGRSGQKLDEMVRAMGLTREAVYVANVVKCRAFLPGPPPKDRPPQPDEAAACMPYLVRQIEVVRPKVIVTLGLSATQYLLGLKRPMSRMRGNWFEWKGIPLMPTFHPSYILRNYTPDTRRAVWEDLKQVMEKLNVKPPSRPV
ncbi:MAG: uncharacterized protein JWO31_2373, partial [Phycisphaerales bacterium]|nr:uncharacterized protein [Phycisphaerales bacterium]